MLPIERISIDLSNYCSKACDFCYNGSSSMGKTFWQPNEVIKLVTDCAQNGTKAISLGGGEPVEYKGLFEIIEAIKPLVYVSVTSNGIPLLNENTFRMLRDNKPNLLHFTIHNPTDSEEVRRTLYLFRKTTRAGIRTGLNFLVSANQIEESRKLVEKLFKMGLNEQQIIFIPRKFSQQPTTVQVAYVAGKEHFQSTYCLSSCNPSPRFCSISWDKKVNFCSYSPSKVTLEGLTYNTIINALQTIEFKQCE
jgi:organic radical activating enzyme